MKTKPASGNKKKSLPAKTSAPTSTSFSRKVPAQSKKNKKQIEILPVKKAEARGNAFTVVAIGASAGGLEAITKFLKNLLPDTGMAYIYVQHLNRDHESILASILSKVTKMKVQDVENMDKMEPNNVYIIPYNKGIEVTDGHIKLIPRPKTFTLSIDVLFSSLAESHKENVIGIILSGSGSDGSVGLKEIKMAGGITFAQDDSAKFISMPKSAIAQGVVDYVMSAEEIAKKLNWMSKHPLIKLKGIKSAPEDEIEDDNGDLKVIIVLLLKIKNVDFSHYKMSTIKRRILRRMLTHKITSLKQYAELCVIQKEEINLLYTDLLINVTEFFRDSDAFLLLKKSIFPQLLKNKTLGETLRIWVAGCATGEEVYSIAMLLLEIQDTKYNTIPFQIFASDLSKDAINEARNGEYSIQQLKNVSPKRLHRFFTRAKDKYRITKTLRDVCIFAPHNILRDPPFSRMDFISCRNLLIYLDTPAQKKAIATFHYALNENGCLMLGKSETIGASVQLFSTPLNRKYKIYTRKNNSGTTRIAEITPRKLQTNVQEKQNMSVNQKKLPGLNNGNLGSLFDSFLLTQYVPASVVINHDLEILQFRGQTSLYLQNSSGKASLNILKMAHIEITFELRNAIHNAIKTKQPVVKTGIEMSRDKAGIAARVVKLEVTPLKVDGEEDLLIIVFSAQPQTETLNLPVKAGKNNSIAKDRRIKKLEEEIAAARYDMASITQDQEAANEELQSANEEIVSSNEELQSLNEELETSKEEIESTNEELITTNQELQARIQQVEELFIYYEAILSTLHEPMLVLDKHMRIKSANKSFCKTFHVTDEDSIGMSLFKLGNNQWNIPRLRELLEDIVPKKNQFHDFEVEHEFPVIGHKFMLLNAHRIIQQSDKEELIVLTISDITQVKKLAVELQLKEKKMLQTQLEVEQKALKKIEESEKRYSMILMQSPFAFAVLKGKNKIITIANDRVKEMWGKGSDIEGKPLLEVLPELKNTAYPGLLDQVYASGTPYQDLEALASIQHKDHTKEGYYSFVYQPYREADGTISGVTLIAYEVTATVEVKKALAAQHDAEEEALRKIEESNVKLTEAITNAEQKTLLAEDAVIAKQQFLSNMSHEIRTPMNAIIGFTNVVLKTKLDNKQKEYINAIKISGDALIILINDILDIAKVNSGKMTFEQTSFNLSASITSMLQLFEPKMKERNVELIKQYDNTLPPLVKGDPMRLRQIILNLLSNAVKFTKQGTITMNVRKLNESAQKVEIEFTVTDTGIGIPQNRLTEIFNSFEQAARETSRFYGGSGLGLAIVKQLVELQGGTIIATSTQGKGSTFGFTLSFDKTNSKPETKHQTLSTTVTNTDIIEIEPQKIKVLVAEDVALNQLLIKIVLSNFGFDFDIVANGKVAIEHLQKNKYDIILMDLQMPEMNGFEATHHIRQVLKLHLPIIALTADVTPVDVEKCFSIGMDDYISKPIDEELLLTKIMNCLKTSG